MAIKQRIEEIIVVEGKCDTKRLQEIFDVDTIETIGSAINEEILKRIQKAQKLRGVIVFTDPDFSGEKIRKTIMEVVPEAKHAFLPQRKARPKSKNKGRSLGVEHASDEDIKAALKKMGTMKQGTEELDVIPISVLNAYGLLGGKNAREKREKLGENLGIGYTNGKQFIKRLKMFRITEKELRKAIEEIEK